MDPIRIVLLILPGVAVNQVKRWHLLLKSECHIAAACCPKVVYPGVRAQGVATMQVRLLLIRD